MTRADAARVGKILTKLLEEPFHFDGKAIQVGASVGIAVFPDDAKDAESLRIAADVRMYAGKNAAREGSGCECTSRTSEAEIAPCRKERHEAARPANRGIIRPGLAENHTRFLDSPAFTAARLWDARPVWGILPKVSIE
ncbi:MAG: diguanylate cyclase [Terracidiphilus sp.]